MLHNFAVGTKNIGFKARRKTQKNDLNNSPNATSGGNYFQLLLSNMYLDVKRPPRRAPCSPLLHSFSIFRVRDRGDEKFFVTIYYFGKAYKK